ncbi:immunoglobulin kappa light chain-like isoform X1 [Anguilla anguilla]|uniref:immunoglobulin kappa light chain-like isoform X1 n=1 Tax=Anguilla anguilla TaxID=7936 RepID=UPI0015AF0E97|nr:immunoglobulin kappa light chain-like isoform X1 [Anguilla anguilla]
MLGAAARLLCLRSARTVKNMAALELFLLALAVSHGTSADIILTQSPTVESVTVGGSVTLNCRSSSSDFTSSLAWYLQKPGERPKLLIYSANSRATGTPTRFTGSRSGTNFMLKISGVLAEDAGDYYCQQYYEIPYTFGGGTRLDVGSNTRPALNVLSPSNAELTSKGTATLICIANRGFPSDWTLSWKVDGQGKTSAPGRGVMEKDGLYSWSSTLTLTADEWAKAASLTCEASQGSQSPVTQTLRKADCTE